MYMTPRTCLRPRSSSARATYHHHNASNEVSRCIRHVIMHTDTRLDPYLRVGETRDQRACVDERVERRIGVGDLL
jgi:hypothetical protein